jgi:hypothetical protein
MVFFPEIAGSVIFKIENTAKNAPILRFLEKKKLTFNIFHEKRP